MLAALLGLCAALAMPPAVLGPSGPTWLGPLPPQGLDDQGTPWRDLVVVVSPLDGRLFVQERDNPSTLRTWDGTEWTVSGAPITEDWPARRDLAYTLSDGRLRGVGSVGGEERLSYDSEGRLSQILWPDGSRMLAEYDPSGRVKRLTGPGLSRWSFEWKPAALRATDALGRQTVLRRTERDGQRIVEVQDALGRIARSTYSDGGLTDLEDPRGLRAELREREEAIFLRDSLARTWTMQRGPRGQLVRLELPSGGGWGWGYSDQGALTSVTDPSGRVTRWTRDRAGRITSEIRSGALTRYERDERGLVTSVTGPSGALTRLIRDSDGYIVAIVSPSGGRLAIERYAGGLPMSVTTPGGGRWSIGVDLLGRPDLIEDPTGRTVLLRRGPLGRLAQIQDSRFGTIKLKRGLGGDLNGIEDASGRQWGLVRDMAGRVVQLQLPGERSARLDRDILGEIAAVDALRVLRDGAGRPTEAGALSWRWSSAGMLTGVTSPLVDLSLRHDAAGRIESVASADGSLWLRLSRDFAGRVVAFEGGEGVITLQRDLAGAVAVTSDGTTEQTLIRGPGGQIERLTVAEKTWRWLRDASGHLLRTIGPRELSLGLVRDEAGRVTLSRLSTGALLHRRWLESGGVLERIEDIGGGQQRERLTTFDAAGRIVLQQDIQGQSTRRTYSPDGTLATITTAGGPVYVRSAEGSFGPGEAMVLLDDQGRLMEARPAEGPAAWGIAASLLSAFWEPTGALRELVGDHGVIRLTHDAFGRLSEIEDIERGRWRLSYDVRGRLRTVTSPESAVTSLLWSPDGHLLSMGERDLVHTPDSGGLLWSGEEGSGGLVWTQGETDTWRHGTADQGWPRLLPSGHIALFEGGPRIGPDGAIEPVSGQATVQHPPTPWAPRAQGRAALWPAALLPTTPWHEPLELVRALGGVSELEQGAWSSCPSAAEEGHGWPSEERTPPLGPAPGQLPMREDPITVALICASLPGGERLEVGAIVDVILKIEAEQIDVPPEMLGAPVETRRRWEKN